MLKFYIKATEALKSLGKDQAGVVSFEYVIVAVAIVAAVIAAFGASDGTGPIKTALSNSISAIANKVNP